MTGSRPRAAAVDVAMCTGKTCRRRPEHADLRRSLSDVVEPTGFACAGLCSGPIVVMTPCDGEPVVVERVRSAKTRRDLLRVVRGRAMSDRLRRRVVSGSKSAKAIRRARRGAGAS